MISKIVHTDLTFASANLTISQLDAIVKKLGGYDGALRFLRGEIWIMEPKRKWYEQDGIIYFSVTSNGMTGEEWIRHLDKNGVMIGGYARNVLYSNDFKPSSEITTKIGVIKGELWDTDNRVTNNIYAKASELGFIKPNAEIACLIREAFFNTDIKAMGLQSIVTMHEPLKNFIDNSLLLSLYSDNSLSLLSTSYNDSDGKWSRDVGFAFVFPQDASI